MTLGEKIQLLRKQRGLSQEQLAAQLAVSRWELDSSLPETENVVLLSRIFGVTTDYLLLEEESGNDTAPCTAENAKHISQPKNRSAEKITGMVCAGIGLAGTLILWILSTMIQVHVTKERILPNGKVEYYGGGDVLGYRFWGFIGEYRLPAILILSVFLLLIGIFLFIRSRLKTE